MSLELKCDWLAAPGVREPAEAATWARLEIIVDGVPVTELLDRSTASIRSGFFGSMFPLVEWMIESWPRLIHERRSPPRDTAGWDDWLGWHDFRAGRQGGAMPDLVVRRALQSSFVVEARPDSGDAAPGMSVRFLRGARVQLSAAKVEPELTRFVSTVLARTEHLRTPRVEALRRRWEQAATPLAVFAARLGSDLSVLSDDERVALEGMADDPRSDVLVSLAEASASQDVTSRIQDARILAQTLPVTAPESQGWRQLAAKVARERKGTPWLTGWTAADTFRRALGVESQQVSGQMLPGLLESEVEWKRTDQVQRLTNPVGGIEDVHFRASGRMPVVLTTQNTSPARHFRLAASMYHLLFARSDSLTTVATDSPLLSDESREARAFAAELTAPCEALRELTPSNSVWTRSNIRKAARELGVSPLVVRHQIENRNLGIVSDWL